MKEYKLLKNIFFAVRLSDLIYNVLVKEGTIIKKGKEFDWFYHSQDGNAVHFQKESVENNPEFFELINQ